MRHLKHLQNAALIMAVTSSLQGCGYNALQEQDEQIKAAWSEVLNQYQRRADLVPNLVKVVEGYAAHEKDVLTRVTEVRAEVGRLKVDGAIANDASAIRQFQTAQAAMSGALSRLIAVAENYPTLKADGSFRDLQTQLEGTENRITVARNRFIKATQEYNTTVRSFPSNLTARAFGYEIKPAFEPTPEQAPAQPPQVNFSRP